MAYLLSIPAVKGADDTVIGSKAMNLERLCAAGFSVPLTYALTVRAFDLFLDQNNLKTVISEILFNVSISPGDKAAAIFDIISSATVPPQIISEIKKCSLFTRKERKWAIRSSGTSEDLPTASFAGMYDTCLQVSGIENILQAIKKCWASLWSERALLYRKTKKLCNESPLMAVIIQEMIDADYSGVIFTHTPGFTADGNMLLEYVNGSEQQIVTGRSTPEYCRIDKNPVRISHINRTGDKSFGDEHIKALAGLALKIENLFGRPQDIEWVYSDNRFYFLQTRPVVSASDMAGIQDGEAWTRANIGEVLPGVITPMTWHVFNAVASANPEVALKPSGDMFDDDRETVFRLFCGRVYIRVKQFLDSFCYLPGANPEVLHRALGLQCSAVSEDYVGPKGLPVALSRLVFLLDVFCILPRMAIMSKMLPPMPDADIRKFKELVLWNARCFRLHIKSTAYAVAAYGLFIAFTRRTRDKSAEQEAISLMNTSRDMQPCEQGVALRDLAMRFSADTEIVRIIRENVPWPEKRQRLETAHNGTQFLGYFDDFLAKHGARAAGEFELSVPRWREDPSFLLTVMTRYMDENPKDSGCVASAGVNAANVGASRLLRTSHGFLLKFFFRRIMVAYRRFSALRENMKYRLMEGFGRLREAFLQEGIEMEKLGILSSGDQVFFLTPQEIFDFKSGVVDVCESRNLIRKRMKEHVFHQEQDVPDLLIRDAVREIPRTGNVMLQGLGCSRGVQEGRARVILSVQDAGELEAGEILVAPHTDPGWTPLFLVCAALVTETGGVLSHGATIAREYGVPGVVNVTDATKKIQTGDIIRVNGTTGSVSVVKTDGAVLN